MVGSREKGGGGNEIHSPCACAWTYFFGSFLLFFLKFSILSVEIIKV